ncbi:alpha/beta hydrolase family protein [Sandaracinobacteroides saxicola]|uniref:S9 family peptidase n=1 Tax=Sandaracinobacteroides saxicola TaxID=2759707 RepID=A0A7G5IER8_9SPHN|nr:S9 family peptidase [Sandaracinobacteroides saxicola]QMW21860.1 S9 family peptidase [Sandaracinobacteroides saxicola]
MLRFSFACSLLLMASTVQAAPLPDAAQRFGAREAVAAASLSPDGSRLSYLAPAKGPATALLVVDLASNKAVPVTRSDGNPNRLFRCDWVSNARLLCQITGASATSTPTLATYTRSFALDADGGNMKPLTVRQSTRTMGILQFDGDIIGWSPDDTARVLMSRELVPEEQVGSRLNKQGEGLGVDWVDTVTNVGKPVEKPRKDAVWYGADASGTVRLMTIAGMDTTTQMRSGEFRYFYRKAGSREWERFSVPGGDPWRFDPQALSPDGTVAYAVATSNGRRAIHSVSLDGNFTTQVVADSPQVDVDTLYRFGRRGRVIGAEIVTDRRQVKYLDAGLERLAANLGKAIPNLPLIDFIAASRDEQKILLLAHADTDPGRYYLFDRKTRQLNELSPVRPQLEGVKLASVRAVSIPAADGKSIPGYLTLPTDGPQAGLPAIVMPHGGPAARDEWGFDWLAQYFAHLGYAVLQPNFRGSTGYGEDWFGSNGFRGWKTAIADINAGARWLEAQGIAGKGRLAIVGWSYGGYAALQAQVLDPGLYRASVAIAPVTDFQRLIEDARFFTNRDIVAREIGAGPHLVEGSPERNVAAFTAPVLMFSGDKDTNVSIRHARALDAALKAGGKESRLVVYPGLEHSLVDSAARADMLRQSADFLKAAMGK